MRWRSTRRTRSLHLRAVAQPGGAGAQPEVAAAGVRAPQGAAELLPLHHAAGRQLRASAVHPARRPHREPPRRPVPGDGGARAPRVPGHPQRGRRDRGGRGREPHPGPRARTAPSSLRSADPPRDHRGHGPGDLDLLVRELDITEQEVFRLPSPLDLGGLFEIAKINRPDLHYPKHVPTTPVQFQRASRTRSPTCSARSPRGTSWCTTRTSPSRRACRRSSSRPPPTRTSSRSSRRCTARRATAPSSRRSSTPPPRASRSWRSWRSRRASTSRTTSRGPASSRRPACTWSTAWSG